MIAGSELISRLGVNILARSLDEVLLIGRLVEDLGYYGVGVADSPILYDEMYPAITLLLDNTQRIRVGAHVTNVVSRHWTVHASSARTFEQLAPGRFFLGLGSGDGAVHTVGLPPARATDFAQAIHDIRAAGPAGLPVHVAASGPRGSTTFGSLADSLILGTGLDDVAIAQLIAHAHAPSHSRRPTAWGHVYVDVAETDDRLPAIRATAASFAVGLARLAFAATFESKNVPARFEQILRERLAGYEFLRHADGSADSPNSIMFDDVPEVRDYLIERFTAVGTAATVREKLGRFLDSAGLEGVWMVVGPRDPAGVLRRLAGRPSPPQAAGGPSSPR